MGTVSVLVVAALVGCIAWYLREGAAPSGPRLSADLPATLLLRAGFPVTNHNVDAVHEGLGTLFLTGATATDAELGARVAEATGVPQVGPQGISWPQRVLDAIAVTDPRTAQRLAAGASETLLATAGTGTGIFGGSVFEPVPVIPRPRSPLSSGSLSSASPAPAPPAPAPPAPAPSASAALSTVSLSSVSLPSARRSSDPDRFLAPPAASF